METATATVHPIAPAALPLATIERGTLRAMLEGVTLTMSKDETRPHLAGVLFLFDGVDLTLISTDGHRLTTVKARCVVDGAVVDYKASYLIPASRVGLLLKTVKCAAKIASEPVSFELSNENRFDLIMFNADRYTCQVNEANFPPYDKVIPKERDTDGTDGCNVIAVSAAYLGDVAKAGRHLAHVKSGGIHWSVAGNRDPIRIDMNNSDTGTETVIVIMPTRL
jgi:DNA polymerase III sliding clamp (beta) subunit (PCNA family)